MIEGRLKLLEDSSWDRPHLLWQMAKVGKHGSLRVDGKHWYAHRYYWFKTYGYVPTQLNHLCQYSLCCEPTHMYEGTQKENLQDMYKAHGISTPLYFRCGHIKSRDNRLEVRKSRVHNMPVFICLTCKRERNRRG